MTLDEEDIEAVASRVVELLRDQPATAGGLVDAATLATVLDVDRGWVYARARKLGAVRLGDGPKARLRFDVHRARAALAALAEGGQSPPDAPRARRRGRPRAHSPASDVRLIQGRAGP